jgi:ATP-dependent DNA helicase DinG
MSTGLPTGAIDDQQPSVRADISVPQIGVLSVFGKSASYLSPDGELKSLNREQAVLEINNSPVLVCHAPYTRHRLGNDKLNCFDILELYAFVHPARFCVPTPASLATTLGLTPPEDTADYPYSLHEAMKALLTDFAHQVEHAGKNKARKDPLEIAATMGQQGKGWVWTPYLFAACGKEYNPAAPLPPRSALATWKSLPEWSEEAPRPPPSHHHISEDESEQKLKELLETKNAESRPQQIRYARQMTPAFSPLDDENIDDVTGEVNPHIVLAEAGTGVGKTLGYIAPSSVWADKNDGAVWISTYTKNLQRQIDQELDKLYPDEHIKNQHVAIRKGRENYLCLLNLEDLSASAGIAKSIQQSVAAGIMARWAEVSHDGDMQGGDFPGWLPALLGYRYTRSLSDTRGECIFSACDHYHRCFVERATRKAKHAKIVVANHAVVMTQTALSSPLENLPQRYVFDEGHHLFHAADSAFSAHLTARETHELRRWILGPEGGSRQSRARGLKKRVEDLIVDDADLVSELEAILFQARHLPAFGWSKRLRDRSPQGDTETFLLTIYDQVYARSQGKNGPYSLETEAHPVSDAVTISTKELIDKLKALQKPMQKLSRGLQQKLSDHVDTLDADTKKRLEAVAAGIDRRCEFAVTSWIDMLGSLMKNTTPEMFMDWMEIERIDGKAIDVGLYRHWVDPMKPFADALKPHAHGVAITSATLCDRTDDMDENWRVAQEMSGAKDLSPMIMQFQENSPYNYADQSRVFIISDVN